MVYFRDRSVAETGTTFAVNDSRTQSRTRRVQVRANSPVFSSLLSCPERWHSRLVPRGHLVDIQGGRCRRASELWIAPLERLFSVFFCSSLCWRDDSEQAGQKARLASSLGRRAACPSTRYPKWRRRSLARPAESVPSLEQTHPAMSARFRNAISKSADTKRGCRFG